MLKHELQKKIYHLLFYTHIIGLLICSLFVFGCGKNNQHLESAVTMASGGRVRTLDPALADDLASRNMAGALYDTLLEYDYLARPYKLKPSMLAKMPEVNHDSTVFYFTLRDDLFFTPNPCFQNDIERKITSKDVVFSLKRLADSKLHSPSYWMVRGKILGIDDFYQTTEDYASDDFSRYDIPVSGLEVIDDLNFKITLAESDPRLLSILAIPNTAVVPRCAVEYYKNNNLSDNPVGSGPFILVDWIRDYHLILKRNVDYRQEFFSSAQNIEDRTRPLPLAENIICYQIRQPLSAWLLFLQGRLDISALDKDNLDLVMGGKTIAPALEKRGIKLLKSSDFEIRYIGFNFQDPILGKNQKLRQAIALAFDVDVRMKHFNYMMEEAQAMIPPGIAGYNANLINPYQNGDLKLAKKLLAEAGYPNGICEKTGDQLELTFDQGNTTSTQRQIGELMQTDLARLGIKVTTVLNSTPRFIDRIRQGQTQLFRYSWVGDYPDAENFLQLFYSGNIGGANRVAYSDAYFDQLYEHVKTMQDSSERTALYEKMVEYLLPQVPWIYEGFPLSCQLKYDWLENYHPHDFAFNRWKYLKVDVKHREQSRKNFKSLNFSELKFE